MDKRLYYSRRSQQHELPVHTSAPYPTSPVGARRTAQVASEPAEGVYQLGTPTLRAPLSLKGAANKRAQLCLRG